MTTKHEPRSPETITEAVQDRYGRIARDELSGCCGTSASCTPQQTNIAALRMGYRPEDLAVLPGDANLALGCGAPVPLLELRPGETVLDLGSGAGMDAFLAARMVGPEGRVIGVDMTPDMLARARRLAADAGLPHLEFREGRLEALPVADASVDAVTSNCVINLVPDKAAVFREVARVLRPGGRMVISDILLARPLPPEISGDMLAWVGCVAGAQLAADAFALLEEIGFEVTVLRDVDYLATLADTLPDEVGKLLASTGVSYERIAGTVRSVTYRATR